MAYKILHQAAGSFGTQSALSIASPTIVSSIFVYCVDSTGFYTTASPAVIIRAYGPLGNYAIWSGALNSGESVQITGGISLDQYQDLTVYIDDNYNGDTYIVTIFGADNV